MVVPENLTQCANNSRRVTAGLLAEAPAIGGDCLAKNQNRRASLGRVPGNLDLSFLPQASS